MTEPHDWPFERRAEGSLRPWFFSAMGYAAVLFRVEEDAREAQRGLAERGIPEEDMRLYTADEVLEITARIRAERSTLAKALAAVTVDRAARERYLDNARAGGAALWLFAPDEDRADRLVRLVADYDYGSVIYFTEDGVEEVLRPDG